MNTMHQSSCRIDMQRGRGSLPGGLIFLLALAFTTIPPASAHQCLGQDGKAVDWFIMYKLPKIRHSNGTQFGDGVAQFYIDGQNTQWQLSPRSIEETDHAIYYTLQQIYEAKADSILYLMFNDEKPTGSVSITHGHTKGVVGFDSQSGFWLIHSAPGFPPIQKDGYKWAKSASDYGQTFMCVSFAYKSLGILAKQWLFYYPQVYDYNLFSQALADFPQLAYLVNSTRIENPPYFSIQGLSSLAGMPLTNFAKFSYFGADLYDALVAPTLKVSLLVETWLHGQATILLPDNCTTNYKVYNVDEVILPVNYFFKNSKDHSKYAVSLTSEAWVCVGGINREVTQFKRGGGTLCFQNQHLWKAFISIITFFEACPSQSLVQN